MPLIIISGLPKSGKSTRAEELRQYFENRSKNCKIISENVAVPLAEYDKNEYFSDSKKEKQIRSYLKSEVTRLLNTTDTIILDAGNYIKGYRYEFYCISKAARTTQCTIFCGITSDQAWAFNEIVCDDQTNYDQINHINNNNNSRILYTREIFDALLLRFEEPHGNNRWDSPLFTVFPDSELKFDEIYCCLYENKAPPPNQSTQNPPLSETNYLFELDKLTKNIIMSIVSAQKIGIVGSVQVGNNLTVCIPSDINTSQLNRLRRQFLNYNKLHQGGSSKLDKIPQLFVQFLNSNFK